MEQLRLEFGPEFFRELDPEELTRQAEEVQKAVEALLAPQPVSEELLQLEINI